MRDATKITTWREARLATRRRKTRAAGALVGTALVGATALPAAAEQDVRLNAGAPAEPAAYTGDNALAQQLSNPLANLISVPFQNNFDYGGRAFRYNLNVQPVIPFRLNDDWNLITRTIVPIRHVDSPLIGSQTGLGDVVQSFFLSPSRPTNGITWGVGPVFLYPTATNNFLGLRQWGAGPTGVALRQSGPWQYGMLANHIWSMGGAPHPSLRVNATLLQPFVTYTFPTRTTLVLNTETTYDWTRDRWSVPINAGVNQLLRVGGQIVQFGAGVRYHAVRPEGGPTWGFRLTATLVFPR